MLYSKIVKNVNLVAVRVSMFSCRMVGLRNVLTMFPENDRLNPPALPVLKRTFADFNGRLS